MRRGWGGAHSPMLVAAVVLGAATAALAQEPVSVTIRASAGSVAVGEMLRVDVTIASSLGDPEHVGGLPVQGFSVVGSVQSQSMEFSFGMGRSVHRVRVVTTYTLRADSPGVGTIGPAMAVVGGERYSSGVVQVQIRLPHQPPAGGFPMTVPGPAPAPAPAPACRRPDGGLMPASGSDGPVTCREPQPSLFLEASVSDTRVYLGEPLRFHLRVHVERDLVGFSAGGIFSQVIQREPVLEGFLRVNLEPARIDTGLDLVGGRRYLHAVVRDKILYPTRAGRLEIGPAIGSLTLRRVFDVEEVRRESAAIAVEVLSLPEEGRPPGFSPNNVARDLRVDARFAADAAVAGQPIEMEVILSGEGNLAAFRVDPPRFAGATAVKSGDSVVEPTAGSMTSRRTIRFAVTPTAEGRLGLPAFETPYFDYGAAGYRIARSGRLDIAVAPGAAPRSVEADEPSPERAAGTVSIRPWNDLGTVGRPWHATPAFWIALLAPAAALGLLYAGAGAARIVRGRRGVVRPRDLFRRGDATLRRIAKGKADGDPAAQFAAVEAALMDYLEARLAAPLRGYTSHDMHRRLVDAGLDASIIDRLAVLIEGCEFGRFAPSENQGRAAGDSARSAIELLRALDAARIEPSGRGS